MRCLEAGDRAGIEAYVRERGWIAADELVEAVQRAGEGNMNLTLRVRTDRRSLVVKQGRPWVEKYPGIAAPAERTLVEAQWYALAGEVPQLAARMPTQYGVDAENRVICMQDLGDRPDMSTLYGGSQLAATQLEHLLEWLAALHRAFGGDERARRLENRAMRELNHEHIFVLPLEGEGPVDVEQHTPGLGAAAAELRADRMFAAETARLGGRYLAREGSALLHGDFFPGSWLQDETAPWVIDPEFGFFGPPEYDVGVLVAHLELADQAPALSEGVWDGYAASPGFDRRLAAGFAGVEMMRRLLGVAQLPLSAGLARKRALLERARALVLG